MADAAETRRSDCFTFPSMPEMNYPQTWICGFSSHGRHARALQAVVAHALRVCYTCNAAQLGSTSESLRASMWRGLIRSWHVKRDQS